MKRRVEPTEVFQRVCSSILRPMIQLNSRFVRNDLVENDDHHLKGLEPMRRGPAERERGVQMLWCLSVASPTS